MNLRQMGAYHDIKDTNSTSASSGTGAGLALPSAQTTKDSAAACTAQKLVELPAGCDALHRHLSSQFARAEDDAASSCVGAVASILCIDAGKVQRQYDKWITHMPRIRPFFAVKANPDPVIVQTLYHAGAGFDCASAREIELVRSVSTPERGDADIIFANCCKFPGDVQYARSQGVARMTFDNVDELHKIASINHNAQCVLRIVTDDSSSLCRLSNKYGASMVDVEELLDTALSLGLSVVGVSFHVGSGTSNPSSFVEPIRNAASVFEIARSKGIELNLLDVGGGFPGDDDGDISFAEIADVINPLLNEYFNDPRVEVIAEPGRFFTHSAAHLATKVMSRRVISQACKGDEGIEVLYYLGDGVYGSFNCILFDHYTPPTPVPIGSKPEAQKKLSRVFGPTCDGLDTIFEAVEMPFLEVGEILVFKNMGAYTNAAASSFNGISKASIVYVRT